MSSSWLLKTRQMSEAGKEIILTQALATHMRSPRDRQLVMGAFTEKHPLEDLISFFGAFYLYHYQGLRLLKLDASDDLSIEEREALTKKERELLEIEVRMMLGEKQREEIDVSRIASEFIVEACNLIKQSPISERIDLTNSIIDLVRKFAHMIPTDYSSNSEIDFINEITGWATKWRRELYVKASGLKESSLSLREELLRTHHEEIAESAVLKMGVEEITGSMRLWEGRLLTDNLPKDIWMKIGSAVIDYLKNSGSSLDSIRTAYEIRMSVLDLMEQEIEMPTSLEEYESLIGKVIIGEISKTSPDINIVEVISHFVSIPSDEVLAELRTNGIMNPATIVEGLKASIDEVETEGSGESDDTQSSTKVDLEEITRKIRRLEKLEDTLEKPVKGMLKAKGLRAVELDKISIEFLTKPRASLLGFEIQVLEELGKKTRVPDPDEVSSLLQLREDFKSGLLTGVEMKTSSDLGRQIQHGKSIVQLRNDLVWYFTIGILKNLARVIETYIRSKHDIQRSKTLLKSIYEDSESSLQFLREEILIDLLSMRLYEMKMIHPELDASTVCTWYQARLSNTDLDSAREFLENSISPVFAGIVSSPLNLTALTFDNYAIAYDLMQRFLNQQRTERDIRIELVSEAKLAEEQKRESAKSGLDVMNFIYTKAHTVFRAIGRVGSRGLEWNANDDAKCANLLAFFLKTSRARPICQVCGEISDDKKCSTHGKGQMNDSNDVDNLSWFVMRAITDIKEGLLGAKAEPLTWSESRQIVQREIANLRRRGKITSKTNLKAMLPGEINYIVGPAIATIIGKYFNESLEYAARRAGIA
ncbi:MAG: hypothetical protein ACFFEJ_04120 [Candidatus Thorarchaeota archaeon]